jgi:hypothetical protein
LPGEVSPAEELPSSVLRKVNVLMYAEAFKRTLEDQKGRKSGNTETDDQKRKK